MEFNDLNQELKWEEIETRKRKEKKNKIRGTFCVMFQ